MQVSEFWEEQRIKVQNMMENKRSPCSFDQGTFICLPNKRHKADPSISSKEEQRIKVQNMMENTRSPCSFDQGTFTCLPTKGHKADPSISPKENKVKLGERITALQQLVSPYGKTDTASVLLEAMEYIQFLHEQVEVLSTPYLQCTSADQMQELEQYSLGGRGLCLVPLSCTAGVARSNGADIWAPIKATSKFENTS